jgi:transcriptional regulator with XRE-family HTH domain
MTLGERIRRARERLGLSQQALADRIVIETPDGKKISVSKTAIANWELGKNAPLKKYHAVLAAILDIPLSAFNPHGGFQSQPETQALTLPFQAPLIAWGDLGLWAGGEGGMATEALQRRQLPTSIPVTKDHVWVPMPDDSMAEEFQPDEPVLIERGALPQENECCLVQFPDGTFLLRWYVPRGGQAYDLVPENPEWPTVTVNARNPAKIVGVVAAQHRNRPTRRRSR